MSPDAQAIERKSVHDALVKELKLILEAYVAANRPRPEPFAAAPNTHNAAAYWQKDEILGATTIGTRERVHLRYDAKQPLVYLRIRPPTKISPLTIQMLNDYNVSSIEPLCLAGGGWSNERNRYGVLTYAHPGDRNGLLASTQVFRSGEVWGVNYHLLRDRNQYPKIVPSRAYQTGLRRSLNTYLHTARRHFGYPASIVVETGLVNVVDFKLAMPDNYYERFWEPIFGDIAYFNGS